MDQQPHEMRPRITSVRARLAWLVGFCVVLVVVAQAAIVGFVVRQILEQQVEILLRSAATARVQTLREYSRDQREDLQQAAHSRELVAAMGGRADLDQVLAGLRAGLPDAVDLWVADLDGKIVAATDPDVVGQDVSGADAFLRGLREPAMGLREPGRLGWSSAPITAGEDRLGVLLATRDEARLTRLLEETTQAYRSDRLVIASVRDDQLVVHHPADVGILPLDPGSPMAAASTGDSGFTRTTRFDGRDVLAAYESVGTNGWGLVLTVNVDEALAPVRRLQALVVGVGGVFAAASILAALVASAWFSIPLERLMRAEARAKVGEQRFAALADGTLDAIVLADHEGKVARFNRAAEGLFGWSSREVVGMPLTVLMPERYRQAHDAGLRRFLETGEAHLLGRTVEVEGLRRNGEEFPLGLSLSGWRQPDGNYAFGAIIRDLTEQRRVTDELRRAKDEAESANRAKSEFLANMSHEIRTPMNGVLGMLDLLLAMPLEPEQRDYATTARDSALTLLRLLNDVLDLARIESRRLELEKVEFNLHDTLSETLRTLATRAADKGVELVYDIPLDVPTRLVGDPIRLRQVVVNLVSNAIKFTEEGEIVVRAGVQRTWDHQATLWFEVADTGIGIAETDIERIFQAFEQLGPVPTAEGGVGLGLAISKQLVDMMDGDIAVESEVGRGSTFRFTATLGVVDNHVPRPPRSLQGLCVLIVDDNETNRHVLEGVLARWKLTTRSAADGVEALEMLRRAHAEGTPFDIVLLDSVMPRMDGLTLAEAIRADERLKETRLVLLSSSERANEVARSRALGISRYLVKPVDPGDLSRILVAEAEQRRAEPTAPPAVPSADRPLKILVVEDDPVSLRVAVRLLERRGHVVETAEDGAVALKAIERGAFDVVLMDVRMPVMDGIEATKAIREQEAQTGGHVPIVALTAHAMAGDRERVIEAGMDGYVAKPIDSSVLYETVERLAAMTLVTSH